MSGNAVTSALAARGLFLLACSTIWATMLASGSGALDRSLLLDLRLAENSGGQGLATAVTQAGGWPVLVTATLAAAAVLALRRRRAEAAFLFAAVLSGRLAVELQKLVIERPRPDAALRLVEVDSYSFPSGHAANSMITFLAIALILVPPGRSREMAAAAAVLLSLMIGATRPMLGVHWPSDVVGGWTFGLLWVFLAWAVVTPRVASFASRPSE